MASKTWVFFELTPVASGIFSQLGSICDAFDLMHQGHEPIDGETCLIYEAVIFAQKVQEIQQLN